MLTDGWKIPRYTDPGANIDRPLTRGMATRIICEAKITSDDRDGYTVPIWLTLSLITGFIVGLLTKAEAADETDL